MAEYLDLKKQVLDDISRNTRMASQGIKQKIANRTATYDDAVKYAKAVGNAAGKALEKYESGIVEDALAEYAETVLAPVYRSVQNATLKATKSVQKVFNENAQFGFAPVDVKPDESRIAHMIARFRTATSFDEVAFLLGSDVAQNVARGAVTDSMRENGQFMNNAGVDIKFVRDGTNCCDWCASMTGTYAPNELPDDFWRVHKDCNCSIEYHTTNTHTRITYTTSDDGKISKNTTDI